MRTRKVTLVRTPVCAIVLSWRRGCVLSIPLWDKIEGYALVRVRPHLRLDDVQNSQEVQ